MINLEELITRCHEASKANGWWNPKPNAGQQLMLVVSELAEALEAHRNGRDAKLGSFLLDQEAGFLDVEQFARHFKAHIKDSIADEMADAYIRLCDFAGGFGLRISSIKTHRDIEKMEMDKCPDNLGECLLGITGRVYELHDPIGQNESMGMALASIEHVAAHFDVDLATHIDLKLRYNATRGHKHGGKAY